MWRSVDQNPSKICQKRVMSRQTAKFYYMPIKNTIKKGFWLYNHISPEKGKLTVLRVFLLHGFLD